MQHQQKARDSIVAPLHSQHDGNNSDGIDRTLNNMSSTVATRVTVVSAPVVPPNSGNVSKRRFLHDLESEICTLAARCQFKQQQRDPLYSFFEDDEDDLADLEEEDTNLLAPLSLESNNGIKAAFLDRLAELLCYEKKPSLITSTALIHSEDGVTIVASRNSASQGETWSNKDIKMLEYLAQILERISSDGLYLFPASRLFVHCRSN